MKTTLKDLLSHKFPMDETEQAILLSEISGLEKNLKEVCTANAEWRDEWFKRNPRRLKRENPYLPIVHVIQQILGDNKE